MVVSADCALGCHRSLQNTGRMGTNPYGGTSVHHCRLSATMDFVESFRIRIALEGFRRLKRESRSDATERSWRSVLPLKRQWIYVQVQSVLYGYR